MHTPGDTFLLRSRRTISSVIGSFFRQYANSSLQAWRVNAPAMICSARALTTSRFFKVVISGQTAYIGPRIGRLAQRLARLVYTE